MSSTTTEDTTTAPSAPSTPDTNIHLDCMIIEAGIIVNSLNSNDAGKALAAKIGAATDAAWAQLNKDVVLDLTPFEAGMALDALSGGQANVTGDLINRIYTLLNDLMNSLGITALPGEPSDNPATTDSGTADTTADASAADASTNEVATDSTTDGTDAAASDAPADGTDSSTPATDDTGAL